ncbi:Hypp607 [Branchiostoma lanceolatum]|uniref:Hypp607 protein n=1 Tax=Branchiostoma lanceolatum TaxID=7740 RepID=A0A8J9W4V4_BRALA|nr:Hypp607 [Branchiostoma lanceolatum]
MSRDAVCPARGKKCSQCGMLNHFRAVCRNKKSNTNHVDQSANEEMRSDYVFSVQNTRVRRDGTVTLEVGGATLPDVLIDSGATSNILSKTIWENLKRNKVKCWAQRKGSQKLYVYGSSTPLPILGEFTAEIKCPISGAKTDGAFVVLDGEGRDLLSKGTAEELKILKVGATATKEVNSLQEKLNPSEQEKYKDVFTGIGLLKNYELALNIDDSVKPVAAEGTMWSTGESRQETR